MKVDLKDLSPVKKTLHIEVDAETIKRETDTVVRGYAQKARIPGFRPGKAPLSVIRTRFAKEVREDVRERVMSRCYREAAQEKGLRPLADPVLDEVHDEEGEPFSFKTTFEVLPEVVAKDYKGVEVRRPAAEVGDDEVEKALEEIRQSRVQLIAEEGRKAGIGDIVVADVEGTPGDGEPFKRENMMMEVGATDNLPAFNDSLEGAEAGAELSFSVDYPAEYGAKELAGKSVAYRLAVHEVKRRELPDLDDELAKDLGEFEDLAALRAKVREDLEHRRGHEVEKQLRQSVLDKVLLANPVVLPDVLVEEELRHRLEEMVRSLMMQGIDPEHAELDWKELRDRQMEPARKVVHARLILDSVAQSESIEVDKQEIEDRIERDAQSMGEKAEKLRAHLKQGAGMEALKNQMVREKSLDLLTSVANIQNEE